MRVTGLLLLTVFSAGLSFAAEDAAAIFKRQCASCHGADGAGKTGAGKMFKLRDLRSAEVQGMSDDDLFNTIAKGKGKMPSYMQNLGHDNIHNLVKYIRGLGKGGEKKK